MHSKVLAIASALVVMLAGTLAWAQSSTSEKTPGHIMQRTPQAKSTGPGASEYAPGQLKRKSKSQSASKFTPSHRTTRLQRVCARAEGGPPLPASKLCARFVICG